MTSPTRPPVGVFAWRELVCRSFVRLDIEALAAAPRFTGRIEGVQQGRVRVDRVDVHGDPHIVRRSSAAARADGGQLLVSVQVAGTCVVRQAGREAVLGPTDLAVYDTSRPYELVFPKGDHSQTVVQVPRHLLPVPHLDDRTAVRILGTGGLGSAVSSLLSSLPRCLPGTDALEGDRIVGSGLELLGLCLLPRVVPERHQERLVALARTYIDTHSDDPALDPGHVAAAMHVSVGHLHRLFRRTGTTVNKHLLAVRIDRCADDLQNSALSRWSIQDIALRRGFKDAAHFTRAFTARRGMTPSAWRASARI